MRSIRAVYERSPLEGPLELTLRAEPPFAFLSEQQKRRLHESRQAFLVAEDRACGLANLVFSRQTGFLSGSIRIGVCRERDTGCPTCVCKKDRVCAK